MIRTRSAQNRLIGKEVLKLVEYYETDSNGLLPVTAARKFIAENKIKIPAIILVKGSSVIGDRFLWAEGGTFGATYAEFNWLMFPSLSKIYKENKYSKRFQQIQVFNPFLDVERIKPEYTTS